MEVLRWARDQAVRYDQAAQHMREVASRERDVLIASHYNEIAERYETLVEQMRMLAEDRAVADWRERG